MLKVNCREVNKNMFIPYRKRHTNDKTYVILYSMKDIFKIFDQSKDFK